MNRAAGQIDNRQRVLDATDIVRLIGEHVSLKPKGREFACVCPFHDDHNPSMYVVPHKQIFHCFVCGAGGNAIDFAMRFHGLEFREALQLLADRAGIEMVSARPGPAAPSGAGGSSREQLAEANAFALRFFRGVLSHPEHGAAARDMIERRGISPEMVESFGIGASPDRWDGLVQMIEKNGLSPGPFLDAGLLKRRTEGNGHYDALRHRLIFPIFDQLGRAVGFGGRKMRDEDEPKYLNSPETRLFDKGSTLFGLKQALKGIQAERRAVVTEGYTDVIACHQAGITNVVATLGTALTTKHAAILRRVCSSLVLLFDGDDAGQRAADRALEVVFAEPIDVRIAVLPGGLDPDELLKEEGGAERFRAVLDGARDFIDYRFERLRARLDAERLPIGSAGRASAIEAEIDRLVELGLRQLSPIRQQTVVLKLSRLAGLDAAAVTHALARRGLSARPGRAPSAPGSGGVGVERPNQAKSALEHALGCLLVDPVLAEADPLDTQDILKSAAYGSPLLARVAEVFSELQTSRSDLSLSALLLDLEDGAARSAATGLAAEVERITDGEHTRVVEHWRQCIRRLRLERLTSEGVPESTAQASMAGGAELSVITAAIERRRRVHAELGGNPLALPRPRGAGG